MSLKWRGRAIIFLLCLAGGLVYLSVGAGLRLFDEARFALAAALVLAGSVGAALSVEDPARWVGRLLDGRR